MLYYVGGDFVTRCVGERCREFFAAGLNWIAENVFDCLRDLLWAAATMGEIVAGAQAFDAEGVVELVVGDRQD